MLGDVGPQATLDPSCGSLLLRLALLTFKPSL